MILTFEEWVERYINSSLKDSLKSLSEFHDINVDEEYENICRDQYNWYLTNVQPK